MIWHNIGGRRFLLEIKKIVDKFRPNKKITTKLSRE